MSRDQAHDDTEYDRRTDDVPRDDDYDVDADRAWDPPADDPVARRTAASDDEAVYADGRESDDGWLGIGLAGTLLLTGVILFLFPEPATSMLGIGLIVAGLVVWVATEM